MRRPLRTTLFLGVDDVEDVEQTMVGLTEMGYLPKNLGAKIVGTEIGVGTKFVVEIEVPCTDTKYFKDHYTILNL